MIVPPIEPMLAKPVAAIPDEEGWLFEPKWDGFRAIIFKNHNEVYIQSRDLKPMARYFPELIAPLLRAALPARCVLDGEVVIAGQRGLDFDALLLAIHPARLAHQDALRDHARLLRGLGPARARRRGSARSAVRDPARAAGGGAGGSGLTRRPLGARLDGAPDAGHA